MTPVALTLVLLSAVAHAVWNLCAKRAGGGALFVWLFEALAALLYAPLALYVIVAQRPRLGMLGFAFLGGSTLLHLAYYLILQRGYSVGDLSLVYPLARGTGPMLSTAAAIAFLGERPTPLALAGAALIGVGVFVLTGGARTLGKAGARSAVLYALATGAA